MGTLREMATGRRFILPQRALVGRSRAADLRLAGSWVSAEHASIWWTGREWRVRDLDSRNGTLLDGHHVAGSAGQPLRHGQAISFGQLEEAWLVDDDAPPQPMAIDRRGEVVIVAPDGVLPLPGDDEPRAVVYTERDAWWIERDDERSPTEDRDVVVVDGRAWTLRLPNPTPPTDEAKRDRQPEVLRLVISVDPSRENILIDLMHRGARVGLAPRAHHEVLLILAEHWLEDASSPPSERGWLDAQLLADMAGSSRATLNVHVQRLRKQFVDCGVVGTVIERRANHDLRLAPLQDVMIVHR